MMFHRRDGLLVALAGYNVERAAVLVHSTAAPSQQYLENIPSIRHVLKNKLLEEPEQQ